jgi:hypothetical protein
MSCRRVSIESSFSWVKKKKKTLSTVGKGNIF